MIFFAFSCAWNVSLCYSLILLCVFGHGSCERTQSRSTQRKSKYYYRFYITYIIIAQLHHPRQVSQDQTTRTYTKTKYPRLLMGSSYIKSPPTQSFQQFLYHHLVAISRGRDGLQDTNYTVCNHSCKYI